MGLDVNLFHVKQVNEPGRVERSGVNMFHVKQVNGAMRTGR